MPRIDDPKLKKKPFKKEAIRSWDVDLLDKLLSKKTIEQDENISKLDNEENEIHLDQKNNLELAPTPEVQETQYIEIKKENTVQPRFSHGSITVGGDAVALSSAKNKEGIASLLNDEFCVYNTISRLAGVEQRIFFLVHDVCIDRKGITTGDIVSIHFDRAIGANRNSRETAIKRLVKKGLLQRNKGKSGANGTLNFSINEIIKNEALRFANNQGKYDVFVNKIEKSFPGYKKNVKQEEEVFAE